jgi:hypothetical protein
MWGKGSEQGTKAMSKCHELSDYKNCSLLMVHTE